MKRDIIAESYDLNVRICEIYGITPLGYATWADNAQGKLSSFVTNEHLLVSAFEGVEDSLTAIKKMREKRNELKRFIAYIEGDGSDKPVVL